MPCIAAQFGPLFLPDPLAAGAVGRGNAQRCLFFTAITPYFVALAKADCNA